MGDREHRNGGGGGGGGESSGGVAPGRRSLVEKTYGIQRKASGAPALPADEAIEQAAASSGGPVDAGIRGRFESATGASLGGVSVHTGAESNLAAESLGARAYATGNQIHFAAGQYKPATADGQHLIAHELTHTVQQRAGAGMQTKTEVSTPGDAGEREADRVADAVMAGTTPGPISESTAPIAGNFLTDLFSSAWNFITGGGGDKKDDKKVEPQHEQKVEPKLAPKLELKVEPKPSGRHELTEFGDYWVVPDDTKQCFKDAQGEQITETAFGILKGTWDKVKDGSGNIKVTETDSASVAHAGFKAAIIAKLGLLFSQPNGRQLIGDLIGGGFDVTIRPSAAVIYGGGNAIRGGAGTLENNDKSSGGGGTTIIQIDPACTDNDIKVYDKAGKEISDPVFIFLGHEMIHARHNQLGHNRRGQTAVEPDKYGNREEEETINTGAGITENKLRAEHGLEQRIGHGGVDKR